MSIASESSAYVILINDDNTMTTTQKRRIVHRSKLVDNLWFLVKPEYNGYNMADFTVALEYLSPVSHKYRTDILTLSEDTYNGYLKYTLPVDTKITAEAGEVKLMITFLLADLDESGKGVQRVRKIIESSIQVVSNAAWSDIIPDCALSTLDQRIIKMDAQIKALNETVAMTNDAKADNISYNKDSNELQLMSGVTPIGNKVVLRNVGIDEDGMPIVDFSGTANNPGLDDDFGNTDSDDTGDSGSDENDSSDVIEF